jgi:hypothetical protein
MIAQDVVNYLIARNIVTAFGTDIFIGEFPKEPTTGEATQAGTYLIQNGGEQDPYLPVEENSIDFWVVAPGSETAYDKIEAIRNVLNRNANYDLANYYVYFSIDMSGILDMDRTRDGLSLYKMSIRFTYRDKNILS